MKHILLIFILFSSAALASDPQHKAHNTHKAHGYVGFHGMALILAGDKVLASHMPLYAPPHNYQSQIQGRSAPPLLNYKFRRCAMGTQYSHLSNFERCRLFEWYHY
ncbi:hypothetical protein NQT63_18240, partial [Pseudoalteromonas agarivorans]|nr:hypothetical protein [Pseudoalteromonas agarivorans]